MTNFEKELLDGIEEVATTTDITTKECIVQAIELLKRINCKQDIELYKFV